MVNRDICTGRSNRIRCANRFHWSDFRRKIKFWKSQRDQCIGDDDIVRIRGLYIFAPIETLKTLYNN